MDCNTGRWIKGRAHLAQSVTILFATPIGTRVQRRSYGADDRYLVDRPMNQSEIARAVFAVADALDKWQARLSLTYVDIADATVGGVLALRLAYTERLRAWRGDRTITNAEASAEVVPL